MMQRIKFILALLSVMGSGLLIAKMDSTDGFGSKTAVGKKKEVKQQVRLTESLREALRKSDAEILAFVQKEYKKWLKRAAFVGEERTAIKDVLLRASRAAKGAERHAFSEIMKKFAKHASLFSHKNVLEQKAAELDK